MQKKIYVLDRNIVSRIKDHLNGRLADNKKDTIENLKSIDQENNIISILPAIDESTLGRGLSIDDKEHFIKSTSEELEALKTFFKKAQTESKLFDSFEWNYEKYFELIAMDSYSHENFVNSSKLIRKALDLYVENNKKGLVNDYFHLILQFINSFTKDELKRGPLLHCLAFLANAGTDNCFSHMFLGRKFANKLKSNENYLDNRIYNVFMDIEFSKHVSFLKAYGIPIDIELKTADEALIDVISKTKINSNRTVNKSSGDSEIAYKVTMDKNVFSKFSDDEYNCISHLVWYKNSEYFISNEGIVRVVMAELPKIILPTEQEILDIKTLHFNLYIGLNMIGTLKILPEASKAIFNLHNQFKLNNTISKKVVELAQNIGIKVVQENMDEINSLFLNRKCHSY